MNDNLRQQAEELGGKTVQSDQPEEQAGQMVVETHLSDPCIVFFELRKKFPGSEDWGVLHVTVRDMQDDLAARRVAWWVKQMTGQEVGGDWQLADTPKYSGGYGKGGGGQKQQKTPMPDDGTGHCRIEVVAVTRKLTKGGNQPGSSFITIHGEQYGWDANAWGNKVDGAPGFSPDWRDHLPVDQRKERQGKQKLYALCSKTSRDGRDYWNVDSFELGSASQ